MNIMNFAFGKLSYKPWNYNTNTFWPAALLKRDSNADVFLWNFQNFWYHLFLQSIFDGCFWSFKIQSSNIRNDVIRMKYWMKPGVNRSNMKTMLNEPENVAWNVKEMAQCCCIGTYLSLRHHTCTYIYWISVLHCAVILHLKVDFH